MSHGGPRSSSSGGSWENERDAAINAAVQAYEAEANGFLQSLLKTYNDRDANVIQRRVGELCQAIGRDIDGEVTTLFGGSVKKHTYVDGISDVDTLMIVNDTSLAGMTPQDALQYIEKRVRERLGDRATEVKAGRLGVTVKYKDGIEIQILPAIRRKDGIRIAAADGMGWSPVVRPDAFAKKLSDVNGKCGGKVVPVIKLFKGLQDGCPKVDEVKGYHIESLAIEAFRKYDGKQALKDMVLHFLDTSAERVLRQIAEITGQSLHVDDHLGPAQSVERQRIASAFRRYADRIREADRRRDVGYIRREFGEP